MTRTARYPGITKAALEISYDNGGINRYRTEATMKQSLARFLDRCGRDLSQLSAIDQWLHGLSENDLQTVCSGEEIEQKELLRDRDAPPFTDQLLNEIFEKVA